MQNKKLLSVCLVLVLLCTCIAGVLMISADAATTVTWKVTGTNNAEAGEFASFNEAIAAAEAKSGEWLGTDELVIDISDVAKQKVVFTDGLLFGVHTVFTQDHTKLPITISGGELDPGAIPNGSTTSRTPIAATNDYTFKGVKFLLGNEYLNLYAGSGQVVFEDSTIFSGSNHRVYLYADNCSAEAFANWTAENVAAEKGEDGLIPVSLTFRRTDYASVAKARFAVMNCSADFADDDDLVKASDLHAIFTIEDSKFGTGYVRYLPAAGTGALSPIAKITFNVIDTSDDKKSNTYIEQLYGIGADANEKKDYVETPPCEYNINIDGGDLTKKNINLLWGVRSKGDVNINVSGGAFGSEFNVSQGDGSTGIEGNVTLTVTGGEFKTLRASHVAGVATETPLNYANTTNISGGTIPTFVSTREAIGNGGKIIHNIYDGANVTNFWGTYYSASAGGGTYPYIENNVYGGNIEAFNGAGQLKNGKATDVVNNIMGGTIGTYLGSGNVAVAGTITNNFTGGTVTGVAKGTGGKAAEQVINYFDGTEFQNHLYGSGGTATKVTNYFRGGYALGKVFGTGGTTVDVDNYLQGGNWACSGTTRNFFYGTGGTTTGTVTNYIEGEFTADNKVNGGSGNANSYLTYGTSNHVVNHFHSAAFITTVYGNDGDFNTITNHYYGTFDSSAHGLHAAAGSSNVIPSNQERLITNYFYPGANIGTFYGVDGKDDTKIGVNKIVNNIDGATIKTFSGGPFRGYVNEIVNNVTGDAVIADFAGGYNRGPKQNEANAIIDSTITNNISGGTFTKFTGGNRAGHTDYSNDTITNNISGGVFNSVTFGSGAGATEILGGIPGGGDAAVINNITGGSFMQDTVVEANANAECSVTTSISGGTFYASFSGAEGNKVSLSGNVCVGEVGQITADEASDLTLTQVENWVNGHNYLIIPSTFLGEVTTVSKDPTVGGSGYVDPNTGMITGLSIATDAILASLDLQERVVVKLWFPKEDVDFLISALGKPFEYSAALNTNGSSVKMGEGKISSPRSADISYTFNGQTKEYYVISFSGIGAADFDNMITFSGTGFSFGNNVLNFALAGVETYAGTEYENLFKSIYDYGAAACGMNTKFDELTFTTDVAAPTVSSNANGVVNFVAYDALMGDAVGIRLIFTPDASYNASAVAVKLDGVTLNANEYQISVVDGYVCVDVFFKASYMSTDFTLTVEAGGAEAVRFSSSVERTVADIARNNMRNQRALALLVYIQQVKAFLA